MKLPWVSREAYDERGRLVGMLVGQLNKMREDAARPNISHPATPEQFTASVAAEVKAIREPDPVARVIREQAFLDGRTDYDLAAHLRNYASQLKREGLSPDEIVGKLVAWQSTETEPAYDKV